MKVATRFWGLQKRSPEIPKKSNLGYFLTFWLLWGTFLETPKRLFLPKKSPLPEFPLPRRENPKDNRSPEAGRPLKDNRSQPSHGIWKAGQMSNRYDKTNKTDEEEKLVLE